VPGGGAALTSRKRNLDFSGPTQAGIGSVCTGTAELPPIRRS
jgi:hypothetical protein